jgi:raffinose/stachyose/melibiose transport system permease protein
MSTGTTLQPRVGPRGGVKRRRAARPSEQPLAFLLPAMIVIAVFFIAPTLYNFFLPFTTWTAFRNDITFEGFDNFTSILSNGTLLTDLRITLVYAVLVGIFQNGFGLLLALLLERDTALNRALRALFFVPVLMSALAVGYIFQALLKPDGALNGLIGDVIGHSFSVPWLANTTWTIVVVSLVHAWKWMGLSMLVYLAGLKSISPDLIEAARIDGAGGFALFRRIKVPLLAPAFTFNVATALIGTLNGFDVVEATTAGGPAQTTEVLNIFIFRTFGEGLYNQASAMSLVLFLVIVLIAVPLVTYLRRRERAMY